jgi:membrane protease YdiL (CAAX protease family)
MRPSRSPVLWFFVLTYVLTGVGFYVHHEVSRRLAAGVPAGTPLERTPVWTWMRYAPFVTGTGPSLAGLLMTLFLYGLPGIWRLAWQLAPWSGGRAWPVLAVCLLLPLGVIVLPIGILAALGASVPPPSWQRLDTYFYVAVVGGGFLGPGLFEEIGWRGFALPHLQRRYSALVSGLVIGLVWAFWHWPNFVIPADSPPSWHPLAYVPLIVALSVLFTWVYNATGGSLFAVVLLHGAIHGAWALCEAPNPRVAAREDVMFALLFAVIAVGLVWRYGAANLSWRDRVVAEPPSGSLAV